MKQREPNKAAALKYDKVKDLAPKVVAKGHGKIAEKIIELAKTNHIPMVEDRNLVDLLDALDVNSEIPSDLYQAVAEVLVFVYRLNQDYAQHRE